MLTEFEIEKLKLNAKRNGGNKIRVCLYARKSQKDKKENSIDTQINALNLFLESIRNDLPEYEIFYTDDDIYSEDDRSGTNVDRREEFLSLIDKTEKEPDYYGACLVYKLDRFSRNIKDSAEYRDKLLANGCLLLSIDWRNDGKPASNLMFNMLSGLNEYYAQNSAFLVAAGMKNKASKCLCLGPLPYGYCNEIIGSYKTGRIVIKKDEAKIVKEIYSQFLEGKTENEIAKSLNDRGILNRNGNKWKPKNIDKMLHNVRYTGTYIWASGERVKKHKVFQGTIKPEVQENAYDAIISKEDFNKVQETLDNKKRSHCYSQSDGYFLTGLIKCSKCNRNMWGGKHSAGRNKVITRFYEDGEHINGNCDTKAINADYIEKSVVSISGNLIKRMVNENCDVFLGNKNNILKKINDEIARLNNIINTNKKKIANLIELQISNPSLASIYNDNIVKLNEAIEEDMKRIEEDKLRYEKITKALLNPDISYDNLLSNMGELRSLVFRMFDKIEYDNEKIVLYVKEGA